MLDKIPSIISIEDFIDEMNKILQSVTTQKELTNLQKEHISKLMSESSNWSSAKRNGIANLNKEEIAAINEILDYCDSFGLHIISTVELESWWRNGPSNKGKWINKALNLISSDGESFLEAEKFLLEVVEDL